MLSTSLRSSAVLCALLIALDVAAGEFTDFGENLASLGVAMQSSQLGGFGPERAIDGNFGNFTHTLAHADEPGPAWWQVDLLGETDIGAIVICNRGDGCCQSRLRDIVVEIRDAAGDIIFATTDVDDPDPAGILNAENVLASPQSLVVDVEGLNGGSPVSGQIVRVNRLPDPDLSGGAGNNDESTVLQIGEVGVFEEGLGCPDEGDSHCLTVDVDGPPGGDLTGPWTFTVSGADDSGDLLTYFIRAEHEDGTVVIGSASFDQVTVDLQLAGTWTVTASVDDSSICGDEADDAECEPVEIEVEQNPSATDELGRIKTREFLVLGPFAHSFGCDGPNAELLANHIANDNIVCAYPEEGDPVDYDPFAAATDLYVGPEPDGVPTWRAFEDGSPEDGDQNLNGDIGPRDDVMSWLVTYFRYTGPGTDVDFCLGSDDGGQFWLNDQLLGNDSGCRGRGDCNVRSSVMRLEPGDYRLAAAAWNRGGGWGLRLSINEGGLPILGDGSNPAFEFFGRTPPPGATFPPCSDVEPVVIETCTFDEEGNIELAWDNPGGGGAITITVEDEEVESLDAAATSVVVSAGDLPAGDPLQVCIDNGATVPTCCSVSNNIALGKPAAQSSQLGSFDPGRAVDGDFGNFHHTNNGQPGPAVWEVDLGEDFDITRIVIHNRGDGCCQSRLRDLVVSIHDGSFTEDFIDPEIADNAEEHVPDPLWEEHSVNLIWQFEEVLNPENLDGSPPTIEIDLAGEGDGDGVMGRYVRVTRISDADQSGGAGNADEPKVLQMGEVEVFGRVPGEVRPTARLRPGDLNGDGLLNIADAVAALGFLFGGGGALVDCLIVPDSDPVQLSPVGFSMLDFNGDGITNIADAVGALNRLFSGGDPHALGEGCVELEGNCDSNCVAF